MAAPSHSGATAEINDEVPSQEGSAQIEIPVAACPRFPPLRTSGRAGVRLRACFGDVWAVR